jgi:hypothetical protein
VKKIGWAFRRAGKIGRRLMKTENQKDAGNLKTRVLLFFDEEIFNLF